MRRREFASTAEIWRVKMLAIRLPFQPRPWRNLP
jgi:hypothetical protein